MSHTRIRIDTKSGTASSTAIRGLLGGVLLLNLLFTSALAAETRAPKNAKPPVPAVTETAEEVLPEAMPETAKAERRLAKKPRDRAIKLSAARGYLRDDADKPTNVAAAKQHATEMLQDNPADFDALLVAAQTSLLQGDASASASYYRAATIANGNSATAFLGLGDALGRLGDEAGSTAAFARYRSLKGMQPLATTSN